MKAVLISIKPKWCLLISELIKTIEVRKTRPKIETPFKCYIYCTKDALLTKSHSAGVLYVAANTKFQKALEDIGNVTYSGKIIGEFVCDWINEYSAEFVDDDCYEEIRQIFEDDGEEDYCTITSNEDDNPDNCTLCIKSCLSFNDIKKYIGINFYEKRFYGWHISNLKIYDKPKKLSKFGLSRAPQSWCYVEVAE